MVGYYKVVLKNLIFENICGTTIYPCVILQDVVCCGYTSDTVPLAITKTEYDDSITVGEDITLSDTGTSYFTIALQPITKRIRCKCN